MEGPRGGRLRGLNSKSEIWREIGKYGKKLHDKGYMVSHSGNLSVRGGDKMYIKRRGAAADEIGPEDVVEVDLFEEDSSIVLSSTETMVHRAVYLETSALAVIHAHPPYSIVCSLIFDEIIPMDAEGDYVLRKIPVISVKEVSGSEALEKEVSSALKQYKGVVVRGHGTFAAAKLLEEAYHVTCMMEAASQIRYLVHLSGIESKRDKTAEFTKW